MHLHGDGVSNRFKEHEITFSMRSREIMIPVVRNLNIMTPECNLEHFWSKCRRYLTVSVLL